MADYPSMPFWTDAYIADTQHLTNEEHGIYLRMLIFAWRTPKCTLPNDDKRLATMVGLTPHKWNKIKPEIMKFWTVDGEVIYQKKQQKVRKNCEHRSEQASKNSKARWSPKSLKTKEVCDADALQTDSNGICNGNANQNHNQNHIKKEPPNPLKRGKRKSSYPNDFIPCRVSAEKYWASKNRQDLNYEDEADAFKTYCQAHGKTYLDWGSAWKTRYVNAVKFNKPPVEQKIDIFEKAGLNG